MLNEISVVQPWVKLKILKNGNVLSANQNKFVNNVFYSSQFWHFGKKLTKKWRKELMLRKPRKKPKIVQTVWPKPISWLLSAILFRKTSLLRTPRTGQKIQVSLWTLYTVNLRAVDCQQKVPNHSPDHKVWICPPITVNKLTNFHLRGVIWHLLLAWNK